ncbi:helix-turn-helix domain-containing protein [Pseudomaricurvus alkylphenolicus]|nr:helix-turn-helix domain-containing protein [Pseudomaricurvus alkylphenolicus]
MKPNNQEVTLDLIESAAFLKMSPAVVRRKAKQGIIKGAKPGKCWVFLQSDLVAYLRSLYPNGEQTPLSDRQERRLCHSTNAATRGGCDLPPPTASKYADLLKLPTDDKRKNS